MTECNTNALRFSGLSRRQVLADFPGGRLTSDAGVWLLRGVDRRICLPDAINVCLPDPRDPRYILHEQREMFAQGIFSLASGYEDLNDQQTVHDDPALQLVAGKSTGGSVGLTTGIGSPVLVKRPPENLRISCLNWSPELCAGPSERRSCLLTARAADVICRRSCESSRRLTFGTCIGRRRDGLRPWSSAARSK